MIIALLVFEKSMRPARMLLLRATATFRSNETSPDTLLLPRATATFRSVDPQDRKKEHTQTHTGIMVFNGFQDCGPLGVHLGSPPWGSTLGVHPELLILLLDVPRDFDFSENIVLLLKETSHICSVFYMIFAHLYVVVSRLTTPLTKY